MGRRLIIGAPVHQRGWILDRWFEHLSKQWEFPPEDVEVVFMASPGSDGTYRVIESAPKKWGFRTVLLEDLTGGDSEKRVWNESRYAKMASMRNQLLEYVRGQEPELYLSCDTDMLLPEHGVLKMAQELGRIEADGIAPLTYMTPTSTQFPNAMKLGGTVRELVQPDTFVVDACFGVVLMTPALYRQADYAVHRYGEDLGWAYNVRQAGLKLALTPHVLVKHVMNPNMLDVVDERVGF